MQPSAFFLLLAAAATVGSPVRAPGANAAMGQQRPPVSFRDRVVVRVPATRAATPVPTLVRYVEKKGPKCIAADQLAGAVVTAADSVDLVVRGGKHIRATFKDDCRALGYYGGFYVKPSLDGQVCAGRDSVRSRSGDSCPISAFKMLVEKRVKQR
jgi:hypothetical protein